MACEEVREWGWSQESSPPSGRGTNGLGPLLLKAEGMSGEASQGHFYLDPGKPGSQKDQAITQ